MKIEEAAEMLNISAQSLRLWLQLGHCPFGDAWKGSGHGYQYHIEPERLRVYQTASDMQQKKSATDQSESAQ